MVSGVQQAWSRHGDRRGLPERWKETADTLVRLGGTISGPMSEVGIDQMTREIVRLTPKASPDDPAFMAAKREFYDLKAVYNSLVFEIREAKKKLDRVRADPVHLILADLRLDLLDTDPGLAISSSPEFRSVLQAREAVRALQPTVTNLIGWKAALVAAANLGNQEPAEVNRRMIFALHARIEELERTVAACRRTRRRHKAQAQ